MTNAISAPRAAARPSPTSKRLSTDATRKPSANCPGVNWNSRTASTPSTSQTPSTAGSSFAVEELLAVIRPKVTAKRAKP